MPALNTDDATLFVEVDGEGPPVTVFAHGLTNSRLEMAQLTPFLPGTKVRFDFRGHGRSSAPNTGYGFPDLARDLAAVADEYGATRAVGTSMGAGAICRLVSEQPDRFERIVLLLPAALDVHLEDKERFLRTADLLESLSSDEAIAAIMDGSERIETYSQVPWMRELSLAMWREANTQGIARAIRGIVDSVAVEDRELLRAVSAPVLIICRAGDPIHPVIVGEILADVMPNAELLTFANDEEIIAAIPSLLARAVEFLS